jgi:U1 small nuclear ribonucleoprotein A
MIDDGQNIKIHSEKDGSLSGPNAQPLNESQDNNQSQFNNAPSPNNTIYINNLNEKIKVDELKQGLYQLFSQFGDIMEIHARKSFRMKGQAFIVYREINSATQAKNILNGFPLFGKQIRINYSKNVSDAIWKSSGSYSHKDKIKLDQDRRKRREEEYHEIRKKTTNRVPGEKSKKENVKNEGMFGGMMIQNHDMGSIPNNTLFVDGLPADITEPILRSVFSKYGGFREVRLFEGKGIAFVEYDSEVSAGGALLGLNGLPLTAECTLKISFAKK